MKELITREDSVGTYMNVKTISTYLGLARSTIYKWVESGSIPHRKLGEKHILFIKTEIDQWVMNNGRMIEELPELPNSVKSRIDGKIQIRA